MDFVRSLIIPLLLGFGAFYILGYLKISPFYFDYNPVSYSLLLPEKLEGSLTENKLNSVEHLFEGEIKWPESFAVYDGKIYCGVGDGRIMKIDGDRITSIARTGKKCSGPWEEDICGRPLGLRFSKKGLLYAVDASYGLLTIDVTTGETTTVLPSNTVVDIHNLTLLNDLVLDEESGMIYMTQSSTRYALSKVIYMMMEPDKSGRLLSYNMRTKELSVLAKDLMFPNGIEITEDRSRLLVAETSRFRVFQYYLKGPRKGRTDPFLSNLPSEPDNIRINKKRNFWIAFNDVRTKATPRLHDRLAQYPSVREAAMRLLHLIGTTMTYAAQFIESPAFKELAFNVQSGRFIVDLLPANGMIIEVDKDGKILRSLQSTDGSIGHLSQVTEYNGYLYLGSWRNNFIGRIKD